MAGRSKKPVDSLPLPFPDDPLPVCGPKVTVPDLNELFSIQRAVVRLGDQDEKETAKELLEAAAQAVAAFELGALLVRLARTGENISLERQRAIDKHLPLLKTYRWVAEHLGRWPVYGEMFRTAPLGREFPTPEYNALIDAICMLLFGAGKVLADAGAVQRFWDDDARPFESAVNFRQEPEEAGSLPCPTTRPSEPRPLGSAHYRPPAGIVWLAYPYDVDVEGWYQRVVVFREQMLDAPAVTVRKLLSDAGRTGHPGPSADALILSVLLENPDLSSGAVGRRVGMTGDQVRASPIWENRKELGSSSRGRVLKRVGDLGRAVAE